MCFRQDSLDGMEEEEEEGESSIQSDDDEGECSPLLPWLPHSMVLVGWMEWSWSHSIIIKPNIISQPFFSGPV